MTKGSKNKLKLLYVLKLLMDKTDENNAITVNEIIEQLMEEGIKAERKAIYSDINALIEFGVDIICEKKKANNYFIGKRDFELPELKILIDGIIASKSLTVKKSEELIEKLCKLASIEEGKILKRYAEVDIRIKSENESIYYIIDKIYKAILSKKRIRFKYSDYIFEEGIQLTINEHWNYVDPYTFRWINNKYYLITYSEKMELQGKF